MQPNNSYTAYKGTNTTHMQISSQITTGAVPGAVPAMKSEATDIGITTRRTLENNLNV